MGKELNAQIFSRLPSKERFHSDANGIKPGDKDALNGYLAGHIMVIISGDFIQEQLDRISSSIEQNRSGAALIASQAQASMFRGLQAAQNTVQNSTDSASHSKEVDLVDKPPAYTLQDSV